MNKVSRKLNKIFRKSRQLQKFKYPQKLTVLFLVAVMILMSVQGVAFGGVVADDSHIEAMSYFADGSHHLEVTQVIESDSEYAQLITTQASDTTLSLSQGTWITLSPENSINFAIETNQPIEYVSVSSSDPSWLNVFGEGHTRTIHVAENTFAINRNAIIIVSVGDIIRIVDVTQLSFDTEVHIFDGNEHGDFTFDFSPLNYIRPTITNPPFNNSQFTPGNLQVRWQAVPNASYYVISLRNLNTNHLIHHVRSVGSATSFTINQSDLTPGSLFRVAIGARRPNAPPSGIIYERYTWYERYFFIQQPPATILTVSPISWNAPAAGGSSNFAISTNQPIGNVFISISNNTPWLTVLGAGTTRTISATANTSTTSRSGSIAVSVGGITRIINVTQPAAAPAPTLNVFPTSWSASAAGNSTNFSITTNQPIGNVFSWSNDQSWLTVDGTGATRTIRATTNTGTTARSGSISVYTQGQMRTITVTQPAAAATPTLAVNVSTWNPHPAGDSTNFTITTNQPIGNVSSWSSSTSWLTVDGMGATRTIQATANTGTISRTGTITVSVVDLTRTITVTQQPLPIITHPSADGQAINPGEDLLVLWDQVQGATSYTIRVFDAGVSALSEELDIYGLGVYNLDTYDLDSYGLIAPSFGGLVPILTHTTSATNFRIPYQHLPAGRTIRIEVLPNNQHTPMTRTTNVRLRTISVHFASAGHTTGAPPQTIFNNRYPGVITLPQPQMTRAGHSFGGWRLGNNTFAAGGAFTLPTPPLLPLNTAITLIAVWNPVNTRINFPSNNASLTWESLEGGLTVNWNAVYGSRHYLTLTDLTTGIAVPGLDEQLMTAGASSFTIPRGSLVAGRHYRITLFASAPGQHSSSWNTNFDVRAAVVDPFFAFYGELGWRFPLNHPDSRHISSGYKLSVRSDHEGIDIQRTYPRPEPQQLGPIYGEAVFAVHGGQVILAQWSNSAGFWVAVRSDVVDPTRELGRMVTRYLHLQRLPLVERLEFIQQGTHIGYVGNSGHTLGGGPGGRSSGHLHLDMNNNNRYAWSSEVFRYSINPQRFFPHINFEGLTSTVTP